MQNPENETPLLILALSIAVTIVLSGFWWLSTDNLWGEMSQRSGSSAPTHGVENNDRLAPSVQTHNAQMSQTRPNSKILMPEMPDEFAVPETAASHKLSINNATIDKLENYLKIKASLENGLVEYSSDTTNVLGEIENAWIKETSSPRESGAGALIHWSDGVVSSILFLENYRVRVWEDSREYGGSWAWSSTETLQVQMDDGSRYRFR